MQGRNACRLPPQARHITAVRTPVERYIQQWPGAHRFILASHCHCCSGKHQCSSTIHITRIDCLNHPPGFSNNRVALTTQHYACIPAPCTLPHLTPIPNTPADGPACTHDTQQHTTHAQAKQHPTAPAPLHTRDIDNLKLLSAVPQRRCGKWPRPRRPSTPRPPTSYKQQATHAWRCDTQRGCSFIDDNAVQTSRPYAYQCSSLCQYILAAKFIDAQQFNKGCAVAPTLPKRPLRPGRCRADRPGRCRADRPGRCRADDSKVECPLDNVSATSSPQSCEQWPTCRPPSQQL
jgi:hypothetical protein